MIATKGGATLKTTGSIAGTGQTNDATCVSTPGARAPGVDATGDETIAATTDGGYHWSTEMGN